MQTTITFEWTRSVAKEVDGAMARITSHGADMPVSRAYLEHVHDLYNYGMNASNDRVLVKNCIVQCFSLAGALTESVKGKSFTIDIFKVFRRLLIQNVGSNLFQANAEKTKELTSLQQEALFLKFQRKLSYREIADIMDLPIEQLRGHISKAVGTLLREK